MTQQPLGNQLPCLAKRKNPLAPPGKSCTPEALLSKTRPCRWPSNYSARTRHTPCNATSRRGRRWYRDKAPAYTLCNDAARWGATSAPTRRQPFEYSWPSSITRRSTKTQASRAIDTRSTGNLLNFSRRSPISANQAKKTRWSPFASTRIRRRNRPLPP